MVRLASAQRARTGAERPVAFAGDDSYKKFEFEHRPAYAELSGPNPTRSLRTREFALLETTQAGATKLALFDRSADPEERFDIASTRPDLCAKLHAELERAAFGAVRTP